MLTENRCPCLLYTRSRALPQSQKRTGTESDTRTDHQEDKEDSDPLFTVHISCQRVWKVSCFAILGPETERYTDTDTHPNTSMSSRSVMPVFELLGAFVVVFVLQYVTAFANLVGALFVLQPPITENPWTIVTSVFAHAHLGHLISNAVGLVLIGLPVAMYTTRARFHTFFVFSGALAGVSQIVLSDLISVAVSVVPFITGYGPSAGVLGASGGVFALLGYLLSSNRLSTTLGSAISPPKWITYSVFFVIAVAITFVTASPGAALIAHFTGFIFGLVTGRFHILDPGPRSQ